ncbi:MAG: hypothetical protein WAK31_28190 [Chthoniobacterales bacterium]
MPFLTYFRGLFPGDAAGVRATIEMEGVRDQPAFLETRSNPSTPTHLALIYPIST